MRELMAGWKAVIDKWQESFPPEQWAHFRKDEDGRWQIIEDGATPVGFRIMADHPLFSVPFEEPFRDGDRFVISEEPYEVVDGQLLPMKAEGPSAKASE